MENRIRDAFGEVKASAGLKENTREYLRDRRNRKRPRRAVWPAAVAFCAVLLLALGAFRLYQTPVSYVSIDVNPSVELTLNRFDRILSAEARNDDGEAVLRELSLAGKLYTEAIDLLLGSDAMQPYLTDASALTFTVASEEEGKEAALRDGIESSSGCKDNGGQCYGASVSSLQEAHSHGMSFGKYAAFLTLSEYDATIEAEECRDMTMAELHSRIRECRGGSHHGESGTESASSAPAESAAPVVSQEGESNSSGTGGGHHGQGHHYGRNH